MSYVTRAKALYDQHREYNTMDRGARHAFAKRVRRLAGRIDPKSASDGSDEAKIVMYLDHISLRTDIELTGYWREE